MAWGQSPLKCVGVVILLVEYENLKVEADFQVRQEQGSTRLSYALCSQLGILQSKESTIIVSSVFESASSVPMTKACHIYLKENAIPKSFPARLLPSSLHEPLRKHLESMEKDGIIEPVFELSEWRSPLVVATNKSGAVRICVAFRHLNSSVRRHQLQMPTVEEVSSRIGRAQYFSKLDCSNSF